MFVFVSYLSVEQGGVARVLVFGFVSCLIWSSRVVMVIEGSFAENDSKVSLLSHYVYYMVTQV